MIRVGDIVRTSYNTGPYRVTSVEGGCCCPSYLDDLNMRDQAPASLPHMHIVCVMASDPIGAEKNEKRRHHLNGYAQIGGLLLDVHRVDGKWSKDELFIIGHDDRVQPELI
jgi:hypothetical protein